MKYHIIKKSRVYTGRPYYGPTTDGKPAETNTFVEAILLKETMVKNNPVGWDIYDSETNEKLL